MAKYSPSGDVIWAKSFGGHGNDVAKGIALDGLGNLYVSGSFDSAATFGSLGTVVSKGNKYTYIDAFLLKLDTDGNPLWVSTGGSALTSGIGTANSVTCDKDGNPWITGTFYGTSNFSGSNITTAGGTDIFIAKYDASSGNLLLLKRAGGTSADVGYSICKESTGNVLITGGYSAVPDFGSTTLSNVGGSDFFLSELGGRVLTNTAFLEGYTNTGGTAMNYAPSVTIELHGASSPYALVESQTGL